jgi:predicted MFS family arabinose efflux permease
LRRRKWSAPAGQREENGSLLILERPPMRSLAPLYAAAGATHAADQLSLAALPIVAVVVFDADAATIGWLVALQSAAWLLVSLPGGILVDRLPRGPMLRLSQAIACLAFAAGALAVERGWLPLLAGAVFLAATGTVMFVLTTNSITPALVGRERLTGTNARLELARAAVTLAAPLVAVHTIRLSPMAVYVLASGLALAACAMLARLAVPRIELLPGARPSLLRLLGEGARFVLDVPVLRAIALCALFWNFAFFALMAVFLPYVLTQVGLDLGQAGLAQSAYGAGLIAGALGAGAILARLPASLVLVGGPALSVVAAGAMLAAARLPGVALPALSFFLVGFGPMLWLVCQTSVRQIVTPPLLLGRVGGVIQAAIYGIRPLGALAGGALASWLGFSAALWLVLACFALSLAVALFSPLARMGQLSGPEAAQSVTSSQPAG